MKYPAALLITALFLAVCALSGPVPAQLALPTPLIQAANTQTDASGAWSVTWRQMFSASQPIVIPLPVNAGTLPTICNVSARSATKASGQCWQSTSTTMPAVTTSLLGLVVSPFANPAANASIMVVARDPTQ